MQLLKCVLCAALVGTLSASSIAFAKTPKQKYKFMKDHRIELTFGQGDPQHAVIWLHGLGATADDFPPIVPELGLDDSRAIQFVFPQAPTRPITINAGMQMPGWYDIKGMDIADKQDAVGMSESQAIVTALIKELVERGFATDNIILAGFSQGGAVIYHTGLRYPQALAGLLALSTYLPFAQNVEAERAAANRQIPIFASHGSVDPVVPIQLGRGSVDALEALGYEVQWQTYPMEHQVSMQQIQDIGAWINRVFSKAD